MGQEKERMLRSEEIARERARADGEVCLCGERLRTYGKRANRQCGHCDEKLNKPE